MKNQPSSLTRHVISGKANLARNRIVRKVLSIREPRLQDDALARN